MNALLQAREHNRGRGLVRMEEDCYTVGAPNCGAG
jgi:hypothetical protein